MPTTDTDAIRWDLVESHLGTARARAAWYARGHPADAEAYYDAALDALIEAARDFDPGRARFSTRIYRRIDQRIIGAIRQRHGRRGSRPRPAALPLAPGFDLAARPDPGPDPDWALEERLRGLREPHRTALALRFRDGLSFPEIGRALGRNESMAAYYVQFGLRWLADRIGPGAG